MVQLSHPYTTAGKAIALTRWTFVGKVMSLLFNMLSRLVIAFFPRSKHILISWLQSLFEVVLKPPKNKVCHCFHCFPIYLSWSNGTGCHGYRYLNVDSYLNVIWIVIWMVSQLFHSLLSLSSRGSLVTLHFLLLRWCHLHIWGYWYFSRQS